MDVIFRHELEQVNIAPNYYYFLQKLLLDLLKFLNSEYSYDVDLILLFFVDIVSNVIDSIVTVCTGNCMMDALHKF